MAKNYIEGRGQRYQAEQDRTYLRDLARKTRAVNKELKGFTANLDPVEKAVYSTVFRFYCNVPTFLDSELVESMEPTTESQMRRFISEAKIWDGPFTPTTLWEQVPALDPHKRNRTELNQAKLTPMAVFEAKVPEPNLQIAA